VIRLAGLLALVSLAAVACTDITDGGPSGGDRSVSVTMPSPTLKGLHRTPETGVLLPADAAADAMDPGEMQAMLDAAGLIAARQDTYAGDHGTFARVVIRGWQFTTTDGAGSFLDWLRTNATHELIGEAAPLSVDGTGDAVLFLHEPTGCCHEEVPIYLVAWQRGPIVWTIRASGPRIHTPPVIALVRSVEQEV
jgi:hypothetical protein